MNIIEVGACDGKDTLIYSEYANVWCFEPVPTSITYLTEKFKDNLNVKIIGKAVSDFNGKALFNISKNNGDSSSLLELTDFTVLNGLIKYESQITVDVTRMDTFIEENHIDTIDYFHCDAQGNDLKVLQSFGDKISIIKEGRVEVTLDQNLYTNSTNNIDSVSNFLKLNGFTISNLISLKNRKWYDGDLYFHKKLNYITIF